MTPGKMCYITGITARTDEYMNVASARSRIRVLVAELIHLELSSSRPKLCQISTKYESPI